MGQIVLLRLSLAAVTLLSVSFHALGMNFDAEFTQAPAHRKVLASFDGEYPPPGPGTALRDDSSPKAPTTSIDDYTPAHSNPPTDHNPLPPGAKIHFDDYTPIHSNPPKDHDPPPSAAEIHLDDYPPIHSNPPTDQDPPPPSAKTHFDGYTPIHSNPPKDRYPSPPLTENSSLPMTSTEGAGLNMTTPDDPLIGSVSIVNKLPTLMHVHCRNADDSIDLTYLTVQKDATYHFDVQQNMTGPTIYWCFFQYAGSSNFHQQFNVWTDGPVFGTVKCVDCIWSAQESGIFIYDDQTPGDPLVNAYQWLAW